MSTLAAALTMATDAASLLADDPLVGSVYTTVDPREVPPKVAGGDLVVVVNPPERTFDTWHEETHTWSVWVIAGPANDLHRAWERLSAAVDLLHRDLEADGARPDAFTDNQRVTYPAYVLTITQHTSKE